MMLATHEGDSLMILSSLLNTGTTGHNVGFLEAERLWDARPREKSWTAGSEGCAGMATPVRAAARVKSRGSRSASPVRRFGGGEAGDEGSSAPLSPSLPSEDEESSLRD